MEEMQVKDLKRQHVGMFFLGAAVGACLAWLILTMTFPDLTYDCFVKVGSVEIPTSCEYLREHDIDRYSLSGWSNPVNISADFQLITRTTTTTIPTTGRFTCPECPDLVECEECPECSPVSTCPTTTSCPTTSSTLATTTTTLIDYRYRGKIDVKYQKCNPLINDTCIVVNVSCCPAYIWVQTGEYDTPPKIKEYYDNGTEYYISNLTKIYKFKKRCMGGRLDTINSKHYDEYYSRVLKNCTAIGIYSCTPRCVDSGTYTTQCVYGMCTITSKQ